MHYCPDIFFTQKKQPDSSEQLQLFEGAISPH